MYVLNLDSECVLTTTSVCLHACKKFDYTRIKTIAFFQTSRIHHDVIENDMS